MRKIYLFAAAGAMCLMLASCSADEPVARNNSDGVINYTIVATNQSRAAHSYCANRMPEGFKVWAKHGTTTYIDGDSIEMSGENYIDVTGSRFWPVNATDPTKYDPLSFYAVADGGYADGRYPVSFESGSPTVSYEINSDVANQLDLMYAVNIDATYNADIPVTLNFRHALSQVCFKARNESTTNRITVKGVSICGLYNKGTYTLPSVSTNNNITDHGTTTTDTRGHGEWTETEGSVSYDITFPDVILNNTAKSLTGGDITDHTTDEEWADVLNLLPQEQEAATITDNTEPISGAYFKLTLTVENIGKDGVYEPVHGGDFYLYLGANINWKEGNRYIYTFNFGKDWSPANLKAIKYTVSTDDFIEMDINPIINDHQAILMREATTTEPALYVATMNIGATTPDDYGLYFWWGDITGYGIDNPNNKDIFKYNNSAVVETDGKSVVDLKTGGWLQDDEKTLTLAHDAANKQWGGPWRMPTEEDFNWLINNCTWGKVKEGDKLLGVKVVSKTTEGEIYLPAASCFQYSGSGGNKPGDGKMFSDDCFYWASTITESYNDLDNQKAKRLRVQANSSPSVGNTGWRYNGFPIRAIANSVK